MPEVPGGERPCQAEVEGIDWVGEARCLVDRLAERISDHEVELLAGMAEARLEGIVVGIADARGVVVVGEVGPERPARTLEHRACCSSIRRVLAEGSAGRTAGCDGGWTAQSEAERGIAGIGGIHNEEVMRLRADVAQAEERARTELALNR